MLNKVIFLVMESDIRWTERAVEAWTSKGLAEKRVAILKKSNPENSYEVQELEVNEES